MVGRQLRELVEPMEEPLRMDDPLQCAYPSDLFDGVSGVKRG